MNFKKSLITIIALLSVQAFAGGASRPKVTYQPGEYNLDPAHTRVSFIIPHLAISEV